MTKKTAMCTCVYMYDKNSNVYSGILYLGLLNCLNDE